MAESSHRDDSPSQGGVFGNLPDSRPGTRSPRRRSTAKTATKPKTATSAKPKRAPAKAPPQTAAKVQPSPRPPERPAEPPGEQIGSLEDLAWAGVAAAAEAATLGVRLAGRALDALRGSSERD